MILEHTEYCKVCGTAHTLTLDGVPSDIVEWYPAATWACTDCGTYFKLREVTILQHVYRSFRDAMYRDNAAHRAEPRASTATRATTAMSHKSHHGHEPQETTT